MTRHVKTYYRGALLIIPEWLVPLWPYDLPLNRWPSYCGAGDGAGDWIVPESIRGVRVSPACFIHDVDWATSPDTISEFLAANFLFFLNCRSLINACSSISWFAKKHAIIRAATLWLGGVTTIGALCFDPLGESFVNPLDNPVVKEKLHRLAMARIEWQKDMGI